MGIAAVTKVVDDYSPVLELIITSKSKVPFQDHTHKAPVEGTVYYDNVMVMLGLAVVSCKELLIVCVYMCKLVFQGG